jgi:hypothetical protein
VVARPAGDDPGGVDDGGDGGESLEEGEELEQETQAAGRAPSAAGAVPPGPATSHRRFVGRSIDRLAKRFGLEEEEEEKKQQGLGRKRIDG